MGLRFEPCLVRFVLALLAAGVFVGKAPAQVLDSVPNVGTWVEFEGEKRETSGFSHLVRARFACVEQGKIGERTAAWIEVEWTIPGRADASFLSRMKLLVPAKLATAENGRTIACKTYVQYPSDPAIRPAKEVPESVMADIRGRNCGTVPPKAIMSEANDEEILIGDQSMKISTKLHHFVQHDEEGTRVEYRFWLSGQVPFGVARFAYRLTRADGSGGETDVTFRRKGSDARPQWPLPMTSIVPQTHTLTGHTGMVMCVAFSPEGHRLASASFDRTVRLWDASSGKELLTLQGHGGVVRSVMFSPDGARLASASEDRTARLWDSATGRLLATLSGHADHVLSVAFSPDGHRLASAGYDQTIRMWDAATGQALRTITGHSREVFTVAFCSNGRRLASGSRDQSVKVWDAVTGGEVHTLNGHTASVYCVAFGPEGKRLASAGGDQTIRVWGIAEP